MRTASTEVTSFKAWIDSLGFQAVADLLGVCPNTVRYWRHGKSLPKTSQMKTIRKLTKGAVSYEHIIDDPTICFARKNKKS